MKIYLMRHGSLDWENNKKRCIGITDIDLDKDGINMAYKNSDYLKNKKISKIYTSDLSRCEKSAKIISEKLNIPYYIKKELREINMGIWENKTFEEIKKMYPDDYERRGKSIDSFKVEEGESFSECYIRSINIFKQLCNDNINENIVIICHSGIIKCIMCYIKNIQLKNILNIKVDYGQIICVNYNNKEYKIVQ